MEPERTGGNPGIWRACKMPKGMLVSSPRVTAESSHHLQPGNRSSPTARRSRRFHGEVEAQERALIGLRRPKTRPLASPIGRSCGARWGRRWRRPSLVPAFKRATRKRPPPCAPPLGLARWLLRLLPIAPGFSRPSPGSLWLRLRLRLRLGGGGRFHWCRMADLSLADALTEPTPEIEGEIKRDFIATLEAEAYDDVVGETVGKTEYIPLLDGDEKTGNSESKKKSCSDTSQVEGIPSSKPTVLANGDHGLEGSNTTEA